MAREITQRELRNDSGEIMRAVSGVLGAVIAAAGSLLKGLRVTRSALPAADD